MKKFIRHSLSHPLITGSAILVIGSNVGNIFHYLFNLSMGRFLTVEEYGILASLISVFNILVILSTTSTMVFAKFAASYVGKNKIHLIGPLLEKGTFFVGVIIFCMSIILFLFAPAVGSFLHIENLTLLYILIATFAVSALSSVTYGILQGLLKFMSFSAIYISAGVIKFLVGILLVHTALRVVGASSAFLISGTVTYIFSIVILSPYLKGSNGRKEIHVNLHKELVIYTLPVLLSGIGLTLLNTIDIVLVKHFHSAVVAGQYAALSLMGRSIFFLVSPVTQVFFPLIAQKRERNENLLGTILLAGLLISVPCLFFSGIYFFLPNLVLKVFFPAKEYHVLAAYLGPFSLFIFLYTFCYFLNSYFLSIGRTRVFILTLFIALLQIISLFLFHHSLTQVILVNIAVSFLLLCMLLLYYLKR